MKITNLLGERVKDKPAGVTAKSHEYLIRGGYIKQVTSGVYSLLPPAMKVQKKIVNIIKQEMDKQDGQEVLFPVLMPKELWQESGRYESIGNEMFRLKDRTGHDMVLGMTHEEASVHMAKNTVKSYEQLPCMIYQVQTKLRDEPRARAGLIRVKEFTMKDAYSFHETQESLDEYYNKMHTSYQNIFNKIGMKNYIIVESDSGMMGGSKTHEFMLVTDIGEDNLVTCENGDYNANSEVAESIFSSYEGTEEELKIVDTKDAHTIEDVAEFLNVEKIQTTKAVVYFGTETNKYYLVFIRGDLEVNETKLKNLVGEEVAPCEDLSEINLVKGCIGPDNFENEKLTVLYDVSLKGVKNSVVGANKQGFHKTGFSFERDVKNAKFDNLYEVQNEHICPICKKGKLSLVKGVEIGQIFQLGTKYTKNMDMTVHNKLGKTFNPIMGCYGIGVGRSLACVAEESADDRGLCWPMSIAPWQIYLAPLKVNNEEVMKEANKLYEDLKNKGYEVLYDDRKVSPGFKFAESELMGIPVRIVISPRSLENGQFEVAIRKTKEKHMVNTEQIFEKLEELTKGL